MKKLIVLSFLWCLATTLAGSPIISSRLTMRAAVRQWAQLYSATIIPDSTVDLCCNIALLRVSVDVGAVEARYRFVTTGGTPYYALPDSVISVTGIHIIDAEGGFHSVRQYPPQYIGPVFNIEPLTDNEDADQQPTLARAWADTLQLIPTPIRTGDSITVDCYIAHPNLTADSNTIRMTGAFVDAATQRAVQLVLMSVRAFDEAAAWKALYDESIAQLRAAYAKPAEALPGDGQ